MYQVRSLKQSINLDGSEMTIEKALETKFFVPKIFEIGGKRIFWFGNPETEKGLRVSGKIYKEAMDLIAPFTPEWKVGCGRMNRIYRPNINLVDKDKFDIIADGLKTKKSAVALALEKGGVVALGSKKGTWGIIARKAV